MIEDTQAFEKDERRLSSYREEDGSLLRLSANYEAEAVKVGSDTGGRLSRTQTHLGSG